MAQTFDEVCKDAGILERNPGLSLAFEAETLKLANGAIGGERDVIIPRETFEKIAALAADLNAAHKAHGWFYEKANIPALGATKEASFRFKLAKEEACTAAVVAQNAYHAACDKFFGVVL